MNLQSIFKARAKKEKVLGLHEYNPGLSKKSCFEEARRCPQCPHPPCESPCPLEVKVPWFIRSLREAHAVEALNKIKGHHPFAAILGRVCRAPCEQSCVLTSDGESVRIRELERYAADHGRKRFALPQKREANGLRVAVIGSGPAGMMAAYDLAVRGFQPTVFDALPEAGGVLRYMLPSFRLSEKVLDEAIADLKNEGVIFEPNCLLGQTLEVNDLFSRGFVAVLLALGRGGPPLSSLPGADLAGVYYASELLMGARVQPRSFKKKRTVFRLGERVAVVGNGNAALDCARHCIRLGREVTLVFEATEEDLMVHQSDCSAAHEEGVDLISLTRAQKIVSDDDRRSNGLECLKMDYADPKGDGQWRLVPVPGSEHTLGVDTVTIAEEGGQNADVQKVLTKAKFVKGRLRLDGESLMTSLPGIFAAGAMTGKCPDIVTSMASGRQAARGIEKYLSLL